MKTHKRHARLSALLLVALIGWSSCSKSTESTEQDPATGEVFIKCSFNGNPLQFNGVAAPNSEGTLAFSHVNSPMPGEFFINGHNATQTKIIALQLFTDTLKTQTYYATYDPFPPIALATGIATDTANYGIYRPSDSITVRITRYSGGTIDGNFSGKLTSRKVSGGIITGYYDGYVSDGVFRNIKVLD